MDRRVLLLGILLIALFPVVASADQIAPVGVGQVFSNATNSSAGSIPIQMSVNIPMSVEEIAYPPVLFYLFIILGFICILYGISCMADQLNVAWIPMIGVGLLAFGFFAIDAYISPLVGDYQATTNVVGGVMYVSQTVTYIFSPWVGLAMWGGAVAGAFVALAGALCSMGWLARFGIGSAAKGDWLETDGEASEYRPAGTKYNNIKRP